MPPCPAPWPTLSAEVNRGLKILDDPRNRVFIIFKLHVSLSSMMKFPIIPLFPRHESVPQMLSDQKSQGSHPGYEVDYDRTAGLCSSNNDST